MRAQGVGPTCKERLHTVFLSNFRPNGLCNHQRRKPRRQDNDCGRQKSGDSHHHRTCVCGTAPIPAPRTGLCWTMPCDIQDSRFIVGFQVTIYEKKLYPEYQFHLALEIGREDALPRFSKISSRLQKRPPSSSSLGTTSPSYHRAVDIDQFALALRAKHVHRHAFGYETRHTEFFAHLAPQCVVHRLAVVDMPTHGRIPAPGLDILPHGTPVAGITRPAN